MHCSSFLRNILYQNLQFVNHWADEIDKDFLANYPGRILRFNLLLFFLSATRHVLKSFEVGKMWHGKKRQASKKHWMKTLEEKERING